MNNRYTQTYDVEYMPASILIGRETESGVRELRFDVSSWLRRWPEMEIAILPTAPGTAVKYPVVVRMDSTVAVWEISDSDTAQAGTGSVEIVGRCEGRQVVSASAAVIVLARTPGTEDEAPEPARPWVDEVLDAAGKVETFVSVAAASATAAASSSTAAADSATAAAKHAEAADGSARVASARATAAADGALSAEEAANNAQTVAKTAVSAATRAEQAAAKAEAAAARAEAIDGELDEILAEQSSYMGV